MTPIPRRPHAAAILLFLLAAAPLAAQERGVPPLDIGEVTVIGRRTLILPKARKGEVLDTSIYRLPAGDTLLFGPRMSNFEGSAGRLPAYREFDPPVHALAELSLGSYLSPRALIRGEYAERSFDIGGELDYRGTAGHIDSAEASSIRLLVRGGVILGDTVSPLRSFRLSSEIEHQGESYFLYGNSATPFDRSRSTTGIVIGLKSQEGHPVDYRARLAYSRTSVDDRGVDSISEASATEPSLDIAIGVDIGEDLRGRFAFDFSTSSLRLAIPTRSTSNVSLSADLDWSVSPYMLVTGGVIYASGRHSDSGSASLLMPRLGARYAIDPSFIVFGSFSPELRPNLYQDLLLASPYVDRQIALRPQRIPIRLVGGLRYGTETMTIEGRGFYETGENKPVVIADTGAMGSLRYEYADVTTAGVEGSFQVLPTEDFRIDVEARIAASKIDSLNKGAPMYPTIDLCGGAFLKASNEIDLQASLAYLSEQRVRLIDETTIGTRLLLGLGGTYHVIPRLDIFAEVTNLLGISYDAWEHYSAPGFEVRAGARYRFP